MIRSVHYNSIAYILLVQRDAKTYSQFVVVDEFLQLSVTVIHNVHKVLEGSFGWHLLIRLCSFWAEQYAMIQLNGANLQKRFCFILLLVFFLFEFLRSHAWLEITSSLALFNNASCIGLIFFVSISHVIRDSCVSLD